MVIPAQMVVPVSEVPGGSGSACRDTHGEIQLQRVVGAFLEFDCRKYERRIACDFEIVDHELARAICVMLCVAGLDTGRHWIRRSSSATARDLR